MQGRHGTQRKREIRVETSVTMDQKNGHVSRMYTFDLPSSEAEADGANQRFWLWEALPNELEVINNREGKIESLVATFAVKGVRRPGELLERLKRPRAIERLQASTLSCLIAFELIGSPVGDNRKSNNNPQRVAKANIKECNIVFRVVLDDGEARELYSATGFEHVLLQLPESQSVRSRVSSDKAPARLSFVDYALTGGSGTEKENRALEGRIRVWMANEDHAARPPVSLVTILRHKRTRFGADLETRFSESGAIQFVPEEATEDETATLDYLRRVACASARRSGGLEPLEELDMHFEDWKWEFEWREGDGKVCGELVDTPGKTAWEGRRSSNGQRTVTTLHKMAEKTKNGGQHKANIGRAFLPRKVELVSLADTAKHKVDEIHFYPAESSRNSKLDSNVLTQTVIRCISLLNCIGYLETRDATEYSVLKRLPPRLEQSLAVLNDCRFFVHGDEQKPEVVSLDISEHEYALFSKSIEWERKYYLNPKEHYFPFYFRGSTGPFRTSVGRREVVFTRAKNTPKTHWGMSDFQTCPVATATLFSEGDVPLWTLSVRRVSPPIDYFARMRHTNELREMEKLREYREKQTSTSGSPISEQLAKEMTEKEREQVIMYISVVNTAKALFYLKEGREGNISEEAIVPYLENASGGRASSWGDLPTPCGGHYQIGGKEQSVTYGD